MGFLSGLLGGSSETTTTSNQERLPYAPAIPALERLGSLASSIGSGRKGKLNYLGGYTGMDPRQIEALGMQQRYAERAGEEAVNPAMSAWRGALDPTQNPYLDAASAGLEDRFIQGMNLNVLPGLRTSATLAGHEGGSTRKNLTEGVATGLGLQGLAREQADLSYRGYQDALRSRDTALGMSPMMLELGQAPGEMLYGVGSAYRADAEGRRAEGQRAAEFARDEPYMRAQRVASLALPLAQVGGTMSGTSTTEQEQSMSPFQAALGIGSLAAGFGGFGAAAGGMGSAAIPAAGAANGAFSVGQQMGFLSPFLRR